MTSPAEVREPPGLRVPVGRLTFALLNLRPELLHQPPTVPERGLVHQHRPGQLHLRLPLRLQREELRDGDQRVRQQPLQERRQLHGERTFLTVLVACALLTVLS